MRILLVSDLHYSLRQLDWVVKASAAFDLVVIAGDSLSIAAPVPLEAQSVVLLEYLALLQDETAVVVSSGNHDLTGPDEHGEQTALWLAQARAAAIPTDGDSVVVDDTLVTICPWWDGPVGRQRVSDQLAAEAARRPARWIWVYHWPPLGSPTCWTGKKDYGDSDLGGWIDQHQPDFVLTGHVHESPFKPDGAWIDRIGSTWVLNAGQQRGSLPTRIELDTDTGRATWVSLMGSETADLADPVPPPRTLF